MILTNSKWICCQLGAREHYAIPRALHQQGKLQKLVTDAWIEPRVMLNRLPNYFFKHLRERFHFDLAEAKVHAFTASLIKFEIIQKFRQQTEWEYIFERNQWFQKQAIQILEAHSFEKIDSQPILFAYSYAALDLIRYAKAKGWRTILGQIDPGQFHQQLVFQEYFKYPQYHQSVWQQPPAKYWLNWEQECLLADQILVNSQWSNQALQKAGIPAHKISIVPLVYQPPKQTDQFTRMYPSAFSFDRPMRVLFLGKVNLAKGIGALLESVKHLQGQPVEFWLVGPQSFSIPQPLLELKQIKWIGSVPRSVVSNYYQQADIFLFPTLSDGFGLTQLEAQAWKLPIIASQFCGEVVQDQVNGLILSEVTGQAITKAIQFCLSYPKILEKFARQALVPSEFNLSHLQQSLQLLSSSHRGNA